MASTVFVDGTTPIVASWLNDVNNAVYNGVFPSLTSFHLGSLYLTNLLQVGPNLSYTDTNVLASFVGASNSYVQQILQNTTSGSTASADYIVSNNLGTASTYYGDFGINSSTFSGTSSFSLPNAIYLQATSGDLVLGTTTANAIHFVTNNGTTDSATVSSAGAWSFLVSAAVPTVAPGDNSTNAASTAWVTTALSTSLSAYVTSTALTAALGAYATLAGTPTFTGTPAAPTAALGTNTTQLATTAFVNSSVATVQQNSQTTSYTAVLTDAGKSIYMNGTSLTFTIPANASVAYPIGTVLTIINGNSTSLSIAITTDTLTKVASTTTGTRTLAQNGLATAIKVASTSWLISGSGLT